MKKFFKKFGVRVCLAILASFGTVVVLSAFLIYQLTFKSQFEGIRERLKVIAQTAALLVDAKNVAEIPLNAQGIKTSAYGVVSDQLKRIKAANAQIKFVYILTKTDTSGMWKFVVDADVDEKVGAKNRSSRPGDFYNAARFPELLKAFDQPSADKKLETDEWGKTLSGYAPIRDALGRPIAVLGVDIMADDVYAVYREVLRRAMIVLGVGLLLALIVGLLITHRVSGPVNQLMTGTRDIAEGNLHHRVYVAGDDEISELANSFNDMAQSLEESRNKLVNYFYDTVSSLVMILEVRDHYTLGHSEAVANYSEKIAQRMGIDAKTMEMFKRVALLHDIGKVGVRDNVLHKPDKLNDEEWEAIKLHPVLGEQILKPILNDPLMLAVIRNHHERQDGKGYPDGWTKEKIPLLVSVVTVADSYDAMTSTRAYRKAMSKEAAIEQLNKGRGTQFLPEVLDVFLQILAEEDKPSHGQA